MLTYGPNLILSGSAIEEKKNERVSINHIYSYMYNVLNELFSIEKGGKGTINVVHCIVCACCSKAIQI